jgi:hypothetical protein
MELRRPYRTIGQLHFRVPFAFSPPSWAVQLPQAGQFANGVAGRKCFHAGNLTADHEKHSAGILSLTRTRTLWSRAAPLLRNRTDSRYWRRGEIRTPRVELWTLRGFSSRWTAAPAGAVEHRRIPGHNFFYPCGRLMNRRAVRLRQLLCQNRSECVPVRTRCRSSPSIL